MSTAKTLPGNTDVMAWLSAIEPEARRDDCLALVAMMQKASGEPPVLWGPSIVGFGQYHYRYASGREGDWMRTGFAPRKGDISVYIMDGFDDHTALLARLGRHKLGKCCLYIRRLADVDSQVLQALVEASLAQMRLRHG